MKKVIYLVVISLLLASCCTTYGNRHAYYNTYPGKAKKGSLKCKLFPRPLFKD